MTNNAAICPACVSLPETTYENAAKASDQSLILSLPGIHCIACMTGVEQTLLAMPAVTSARVNLSLKRVTVRTRGDAPPEALMDALEQAGFEARMMDSSLLGPQSDTKGRDLVTRIAIAGFAMMNVMLLSVAVWAGAAGSTLQLFHFISAGIAIPALLYAAQPFFQHAWMALKARRLNMDVPISLAILLAGGMSTFETFAGGKHAYFDAALSLTFFLLIGRYLDHRSRTAAASAAAHLTALEVPRVLLLRDGERKMIDFAELAVGDEIIILPGGRLPVDGIIVDGTSEVDRSMLTGESQLILIGPKDAVTAGEINTTGVLIVQALTVGENTTLRRMVTMVDAAESARNRYTAIADRAATIYAPVVHLLALGAFVGWMLYSGDIRLSLNIAIAVLIITCPCALGLAVPAVSTTAAGRLFRAGLLVKDGTALERLAEIDTVVFDKTGTLTELATSDAGLKAMDQRDRQIALALAEGSSHPVSRAIANGLRNLTTQPAKVTDIKERPGKGVSGIWQGTEVRLGSGQWLGAADTGSVLAIGDEQIVPVTFSSTLRHGAEALVDNWRNAGLTLHLISGDHSEETARIAGILQIDNWSAKVSPEEKIKYIQDLTTRGHKVLMVGDGLNDTGALAEAFASVSPATAADASRAASDVVLLNESLSALIDLPHVARSAKKRILENFAISVGYNLVAIPIALAGLATPLIAAIAMSASSITVVLNALRLRGSS